MLDPGTEKAIQGKSWWNPKGSGGPFTVASSVHVPRWDLSGLSSPVNPGVTSKQAFYVTTNMVCVVLSQCLNFTIYQGARSPSPLSRTLTALQGWPDCLPSYNTEQQYFVFYSIVQKYLSLEELSACPNPGG